MWMMKILNFPKKSRNYEVRYHLTLREPKVDHTRQTLQKRNTRKRSRQPRRPLGTPVSSPDSKSPSTSLTLPMTKKEESIGSQITGLIDQVLMESGNLMHLFRRLQHSE